MAAPYDKWRSLDECAWSEPLHVAAGDATVHGIDMVHRAPENSSSVTRWAYSLAYFPANDVYNGLPTFFTDKLFEEGHLRVGEHLDHPDFPLVHAGEVA
jgi:ectoine hydroxylase-related dioxygenase (phytanoyl-CoA dioxygenase family)